MIFGVLKDIKKHEYRVIATPSEVSTIVKDGHRVLVQKNAGANAGFPDEEYIKSGAEIVDTMEEIYERSDFVAKVKEIEPCEYDLLRESQSSLLVFIQQLIEKKYRLSLTKKLLLLQLRILIDMDLLTVKLLAK